MTIIHHLNLTGVDLNLLVVFDALMSERHVTRAGEKLGLSQPATSNALSRLRYLFDDQLFVRTVKGMEPTTKGLALAASVEQILQQIQLTLDQEDAFVPETSEQLFTIGMSDYIEFIFLARLMQRLSSVAPKVKIRVRSFNDEKATMAIDTGDIDIAIGLFSAPCSWHQQQHLFKEEYVGVCRQQHPYLPENLSIENYLAVQHLLVSPTHEDLSSSVDTFLSEQKIKRDVALSVPHFLIAPLIIAKTDLVATMPVKIAISCAVNFDLRLFSLPFEVKGFLVNMLWHTKNDKDCAHLWLRQIISSVCSSI
jgi:DNA-binding transcriptional LysR family regulator